MDGPRGKRCRVLVVDAQAPLGRAIARSLRSEHDVTAMTDAREALEHVVGGARYDVILCDMNMPGMRGPEFLRELRRRAPDHARRVVFLTGSTTTTGHDVGDAEVRILHKPFDLDALRKLVREFA